MTLSFLCSFPVIGGTQKIHSGYLRIQIMSGTEKYIAKFYIVG